MLNDSLWSSRVKITEDGKQALLKLSKGDMRRALNVLQACHAAYDEVDETAVYNCTGNPHPKDVESVVQSMLRDEFGTSYECELNIEANITENSTTVLTAEIVTRYHETQGRQGIGITRFDRWNIRGVGDDRVARTEPDISTRCLGDLRVSFRWCRYNPESLVKPLTLHDADL
jgi:hypothetical protein